MRYKLSECVSFNPTERLPKGIIAKKVSMDRVQPFCREVSGFDLEPYKGGSKFRNGDTIMARITPCLENGKTAYVSFLDDDEVGYGSTEFVVWRAKEGVTESEYLYYLSQSPEIRDIAIKSMVGSSGRQRVQQSVLNNYIVDLPPLPIQRSIADTLSALDARIAENKKINHHLEQMAQAIFKSWFVDFEPFGGKQPLDWIEGTLCDICAYNNERIPVSTLTLDIYISTENMMTNKGGFVTAAGLPTVPQTISFAPGDTLVSNIRPYFKKIMYCDFVGGCSSDVLCFRPHRDNLSLFVYNTLYSDDFFAYMVSGSKGTKMPRGDKQQIMAYKVAIPTDAILDDFTTFIIPMQKMRLLLVKECSRLLALRDILLPRLLSGELSGVDANFHEAK